jgi:hypothetical protein
VTSKRTTLWVRFRQRKKRRINKFRIGCNPLKRKRLLKVREVGEENLLLPNSCKVTLCPSLNAKKLPKVPILRISLGHNLSVKHLNRYPNPLQKSTLSKNKKIT